MSVFTHPGCIASTVSPGRASSVTNVLVIEFKAALLALYNAMGDPSGIATLPSTELMNAIAPPSATLPASRWAKRIGATALMTNSSPISASLA